MKRQTIGLAILQLLDLGTTWLALTHSHAIEANPIGRLLWLHGFPGLLAAKTLATIIILAIAWIALGRSPYGKASLQVCCAIMVAVVGWNCLTLWRHGVFAEALFWGFPNT